MLHIRTRLLEACRWSAEGEVAAADVVTAALGMAVPVLLAAISGDPAPGLAAALGSLAIGRVETAAGLRAHLRREAEALAPAILAALLAVLCADRGWLTDMALILLVGIAATVSGFSRPMAVSTTRFILFLMIASAVTTPMKALGTREAVGFLILVAGGALWTSVLGLAVGAGVRWRRRAAVPAPPSQPIPTIRQKYARWRRSLTSFAGWNYPIRLVACIAVAAAIDIGWPDHHFHWIGLTVALLTERQIELVPVKTIQRAVGTAIGVAIAAFTLRSALSSWALAGVVGLLAGIRPVARVRNYLAYSAVMTPLIVLVIDAGRVPDGGLLLDRLVATLIGAALVIGTNRLLMRFSSSKGIL
ncbi:MAG TPA: FUSC family protein [Burkholderiaceae bacterium]|nr:FUSC family protein [Burkholderiaceae bacterium]